MSLKIIGLMSIAAFGLFAGPMAAESQQAAKVYRVGYLGSGGPGILRQIESQRPQRGSVVRNFFAFWQGLHELGYVEGKNLIKEYRWTEGKRERLPDLAAELVRIKIDVIVVSPSATATRALQRATSEIPIVMAGSRIDPVKAGFVQSLAKPGGNITGLTQVASELHAKRLELLKEAFPKISRVVFLWDTIQQKHALKEVAAVAKALDIQIRPVAIDRSSSDIETPLSAVSQENPDGLLVGLSRFMNQHRARITEFAAEKGLPTMYAQGRFVKAGGLMSYGVQVSDLFRGAATYVDKILKGAKPGDLPVEQPRKFELLINLKTAKQLGVTIPSSILYRADEVIR